jgi:hypothetical protein
MLRSACVKRKILRSFQKDRKNVHFPEDFIVLSISRSKYLVKSQKNNIAVNWNSDRQSPSLKFYYNRNTFPSMAAIRNMG